MEEPTDEKYQADVRKDVPRGFLVDFVDAIKTAAHQAKTAIINSHVGIDGGTPLGARRGNQMTGILRFHVTDEAFEQIVAKHEGEFVGQVQVSGIDGPELRALYLTTARFGGTLIGFASHWDQDDLPAKNVTRKVLCAQNVGLGPDLFRDRELYVDRERFVVVMVQRAHNDVGTIATISLAIVDPTFKRYVMKVDVNDFLASYGTAAPATSKIKLRRGVGKFRQDPDADEVEHNKS